MNRIFIQARKGKASGTGMWTMDDALDWLVSCAMVVDCIGESKNVAL